MWHNGEKSENFKGNDNSTFELFNYFKKCRTKFKMVNYFFFIFLFFAFWKETQMQGPKERAYEKSFFFYFFYETKMQGLKNNLWKKRFFFFFKKQQCKAPKKAYEFLFYF